MRQEIKEQCYLLSLEGYNSREIGAKLNLGHATVSRALNSITKGNDYQLAVKGCGVLLQEFVKFQDYCKKKLKELNEISPEDNKERIAIINLEREIYKDLLVLGAQGEFVESVKKIRGELSKLESKPGSDVQAK